ncbi:MAG: response regulator transcription factor [Elusimicrobiota bacterium]|nr:response regulator transcription factor [Elusimicrobiota bacterium]
MPRVLIVEDDPAIVEAVEKTLTMGEGFSLRRVASADKAVAEAVASKPDLILLDVRLPPGDGRVVLKALKANAATAGIPVIMLTGMSGEGDRVVGLNLGADDYVCKPFGAMELLARIQAVLRRTVPGTAAGGAVSAGGLVLDPAGRTAELNGKPLKLQPREFEVLYLLVNHAGKALTRAFLIENTSSYGADVETRALDTHIKNIRKKLGAKAGLIETVPKHGYRLAV